MFRFTRAPPPKGAPPAYGYMTKMYNRSLRPLVIFTASLSAIWALLWGISSFRDLSLDRNHEARLAVFDIVLGSLYFAIMAIELFGAVGAFLERLFLVKTYAFLSLAAALIIMATEVLRVVIHFIFKDDLIEECTMLSTGQEIIYRFGIWGPVSSERLTEAQAAIFCNRAWSRDSVNEIIWLLIAGFFALFFSSIAFTYYRQLVDPTSIINASRDLGSRRPLNYNPPYDGGNASNAHLPELGYADRYNGPDAGKDDDDEPIKYAPPSGPPPRTATRDEGFDHTKLPPGYDSGLGLGSDTKDGFGYSSVEQKDTKDPFN